MQGARRHFKTHQHWQPWPQDITFPLLCSSTRQKGLCMECAGVTRMVLRAGNCTSQSYVCTHTLCWNPSTLCTRINNPTLVLDTWLLPVFLSLKGTLSWKPEQHPHHVKDTKYFSYKNNKNHQHTVNFIHYICQLYYWYQLSANRKKKYSLDIRNTDFISGNAGSFV